MDFIEQLPESNGYTAILVIVDRASKQAIFIPTTDNITSEQLALLFVIHVFSKHGVPNHVTCDRGSKFISAFFQALGKALQMESITPLGTTLRLMARLSMLTRPWNSIFAYILHTNRMTGLLSFLLLSLPTTMLQVTRLVSCCST